MSIDNINLAVDTEDRNGHCYGDKENHENQNGHSKMNGDSNTNGDIKINGESKLNGNGVNGNGKHAVINGKRNDDSDDEIQIIPWRAQLRKTNSKLNLLD